MNDYRYLVDFDTKKLEFEYHDTIIIGSGIAGVYTSLELPSDLDVAILTKEKIEISNSVLAQGGIAVSLDSEDSPTLHFKDTIYAGAGLCNEESVWVLVKEAAKNIERICDFGVMFDRKSPRELSFTREAAHSKNRIIHAGDTTGKEVCDKLISVVRTRNNISINERTFVLDLLVEDGKCKGVIAFDEIRGKLRIFLSHVVVCATGGFGQIYKNTTNPEVATGDGICLAYRAGIPLTDLEFVQFHPTVLYHAENKSFLLSEALRGEGAILRNKNGKRFMPDYHEMKELAPRDVVSRAIFEEMRKSGSAHVYLDITSLDKKYLSNRFANIYKTCGEYGIDISKDYIPVAPAEHYCMGGIKTDVYGRTDVEGFYACGEAACTGIHGANRLASNSLIEGLVFGHKISGEVSRIVNNKKRKPPVFKLKYTTGRKQKNQDRKLIKSEIKSIMTENVGIIRNRENLKDALVMLEKYREEINGLKNSTSADFELQNMLLMAILVTESALEREESRGAHFRTDYPEPDDNRWKKHIMKNREHKDV
jgi:L-aspartate oxidase